MLAPSALELVGEWRLVDGRVLADEACDRIAQALPGLTELARAEEGWSILYRDPSDARLWELTYPQSHLHGGGPPALRVMSAAEAGAKYGTAA